MSIPFILGFVLWLPQAGRAVDPEPPQGGRTAPASRTPGGPERPSPSGRRRMPPASRDRRGQGPRNPQGARAPVPPTDRRAGPSLELGLEQCLRLGLEGNVDLRLKYLDEVLAREAERKERGAFDPLFFSEADWARRKVPSRNSFVPSSIQRTYGLNLGFRQKILSGGTWELAFRPTFTDQQVNSIFSFPSTQFTGELSLTFTQPLLRGAWVGFQKAGIRKARLDQRANRKDWERQRQTLLSSIVQAYYDLVFTREEWRVKFETLEVAREQFRNTEKRILLGELAPRDRIADRTEVARREEELIQAENAILDAEDVLKRLLFPFEEMGDWTPVIRPSENLGTKDPVFHPPSPEEARRTAFAERPDLRAARIRVEKARIEVEEARSGLLPSLDLSGSYSVDAVTDDTADLQRDIFERKFPDYSLKLSMEVPIGNVAAESAWRQARIRLEQARRNLQILRIEIVKEIRAALRAIRVQWKSIQAARVSVRLAESNLETERIKLKLDSTTLFEVQRRNQELSDAKSRLLRSRLEYRKAWFVLQAALGRIDRSDALRPLEAARKKGAVEGGQDARSRR